MILRWNPKIHFMRHIDVIFIISTNKLFSITFWLLLCPYHYFDSNIFDLKLTQQVHHLSFVSLS